VQAHVPLLIGAGGGPKTFAWIAAHADGWMTTPIEQDVGEKADRLRAAWRRRAARASPRDPRAGHQKPTPELLASWEEAGVTEAIWGLPDRSPDEVEAFIGRHAGRLGVS
jgi:alkanesulfonate monooxygenase SsuD/methylene tetrahydromethanopterin reductase-like flavin-dependent oxidoreductase (luciferase family)